MKTAVRRVKVLTVIALLTLGFVGVASQPASADDGPISFCVDVDLGFRTTQTVCVPPPPAP